MVLASKNDNKNNEWREAKKLTVDATTVVCQKLRPCFEVHFGASDFIGLDKRYLNKVFAYILMAKILRITFLQQIRYVYCCYVQGIVDILKLCQVCNENQRNQ
ncbi:hypothetical protein EPI10_023675 [Gossypium australe]|uniref:Uncharacterized protein n=1 Tax=Gossypium australe TaxID=47621 RepID=A0A5B6VVG5_9ROSI|nr:hypothetical protein EPI10_023675 [Gossypium australe]